MLQIVLCTAVLVACSLTQAPRGAIALDPFFIRTRRDAENEMQVGAGESVLVGVPWLKVALSQVLVGGLLA